MTVSSIEIGNSTLHNFSKANVLIIAQSLKGEFLDEYAFDGDAVWTLFYVPVLEKPEHQHVVGLRRHEHKQGKLFITGLDARPLEFPGLLIPSARLFLHSRYHHDYYQSPRYPLAIDGGAAYRRIIGTIPSDAIRATFNPLSMKVTTDELPPRALDCHHASDDYRFLRRETAR
jgi:hypothetical protein